MRLVHLAAYDGPYAGSSVPMIVRALRAARDRGWSPEAVFAETARDRPWLELFHAEELPVRIIERASRRQLVAKVRGLLAEAPAEPTILHTHFTVYDLPAIAAARGRPATAVFWHLHTPPEPGLVNEARVRLKFGTAGRGVARVLCVAPHLAERIAAVSPADNVTFFPNGIDTKDFSPASAPERGHARRRLGVANGGPVLGHIGWDWRVKGGDLLLEAVALLREEGLEVNVVTRADDPAALTDRERLGLGAQVSIVPRLERIQELFAAADVFVSSSRKEGMPFSVLEALLSGLPVVASDIPGHALIAEDYPGLRLAATDPRELASAIRETLARDPGEVAGETEESARLISSRMGLEGWSERLFALYGNSLPAART